MTIEERVENMEKELGRQGPGVAGRLVGRNDAPRKRKFPSK